MSLNTYHSADEERALEHGATQDFGKRLLPIVLDQWAKDEPGRLYAITPPLDTSSQSMNGVSMLQMAHAVDVTAWWLTMTFGGSHSYQCLAYIGASDIRYPMVHLASMKLGWKLILLGTRNSGAQNRSILRRTECSIVLYSAEMRSNVEELQLRATDLICKPLISVAEILASGWRAFPYERTFEQAQDEPALVIHSSGSTGKIMNGL
ncbi:MAG: hypothetical protein Q9213_000160 [Squamulea squamosa]